MSKRIAILSCLRCGKKLKCPEDRLEQVIRGERKCPQCGGAFEILGGLRPEPEGDAERGEEVQTRKNALLNVRKRGDVAVVSFNTSRVRESAEVRQLEDEFVELVEGHGMTRIVLNFENLSFMSSSVIGVLVRLHRKATGEGGDVKLCSIEPQIYEVFKIMRLDRLFDIPSSEREALNAFQKAR